MDQTQSPYEWLQHHKQIAVDAKLDTEFANRYDLVTSTDNQDDDEPDVIKL